MKKLLLLILSIGIFSSCSDNDSKNFEIVDLKVSHHRVTCTGVGPRLCLLVQQGDQIGSDNWTKFYDGIEGFDFEPGKIKNIRVRAEEIENPPADASSINYTLDKVVSVEEVDLDTQFDIELKVYGQNYITTEQGYQILGQVNIDCNDLCGDLDLALQNQDFVTGTFKRVSDDELELIDIE
ncbi:DUF4377 domain-containing protein [Flavobacteriaceae bacterium TK19130]|nr:DUF4377 domain-containing protein [Thermobacterium salinum]